MPTVAELRSEAQRLDIPNYKKLKKNELAKVLEGARSDIMQSGAAVSPLKNMRRSELARMYKGNAGNMSKNQLIAALTPL